MHSELRAKPPSEALVIAMYNRFRPFKVKEEGIELLEEMDIVDFLLAMNLLSRVPQEKKIKCKLQKYLSINTLSPN